MKGNSIKNERSSIEEDIILLKDFTEGNFKRDKLENYEGSCKMGYFYYKDIQQAIEHILSDYKKVLKENEELKDKYATFIKMSSEVIANSIPKQKVKDKIKEIKEDKESYYYDVFLEERDIEKTIEILQKLLKESEII